VSKLNLNHGNYVRIDAMSTPAGSRGLPVDTMPQHELRLCCVCVQGLQDDLQRARQEAAAQLAKAQQAALQQQQLLQGQVQAAEQELAACRAQLEQQAAAQQAAQAAWQQERQQLQQEAQVGTACCLSLRHHWLQLAWLCKGCMH
jgi:hypothetical protein